MKTKAKVVSPIFLDTRTRNNWVKKILLAVAALLALVVIIAATSAHAQEKDITCTISQRTAPILYLVGPRAKVEWPVAIRAKDTDDAILKIMRLVFSENDKDRDSIYNANAEAAYAEYRKTAASKYVYPRLLRLLVFGNELQDESFSVACPFSDDGVTGKIVVNVEARMVIDDWGNK